MDEATTLTLGAVDTDAAIAETLEEATGQTRADFLKKFAIGGGAMALTASLAGPTAAFAAPSAKGDIAILNFALTLEYLESAFYREAVGGRLRHGLSSRMYRFARIVGDHENTHVVALAQTIRKLGGQPVGKPRFDFQGTTRNDSVFGPTALALEETGVPAYLGQVDQIFNKTVLVAAARIATVEARHAAWMRHMLDKVPAPAAFDGRRTRAATLRIVQGTGFIR